MRNATLWLYLNSQTEAMPDKELGGYRKFQV
jgi:hypothetical protein